MVRINETARENNFISRFLFTYKITKVVDFIKRGLQSIYLLFRGARVIKFHTASVVGYACEVRYKNRKKIEI